MIGIIVLFGNPAFAQSQTPDEAVKKLYATYGIGPNSGSNGIDEKNAANIFNPSLLKLYSRAISSGLDFDFFVQGQDFSLTKPVTIDKVLIDGSTAKVSATLSQNDFIKGKKVIRNDKFLFVLVNEPRGWRIVDAFSHGNSLTDEWRDTIKEGKR